MKAVPCRVLYPPVFASAAVHKDHQDNGDSGKEAGSLNDILREMFVMWGLFYSGCG